MPYLLPPLLTLALVLAAATSSAQDVSHGTSPHTTAATDLFEYVEGASRLEGEILAPCCWNQTLDIHGSESANALRREIRTRLRSGDSQDAIRSDIVNRYGAKILAVPPGSPLKKLAIGLAVTFVLAGGAAGFMLFSWRKRARVARKKERSLAEGAARAPHDEWDDRLEDELSKMD